MTTYVTLINFTEQGLKTIKDTVKRSEAAKKTAAANGVKVKEILWLQGQYDMVVISESDDDTKRMALALNTLKNGNVRGQTLRAYTASEMEKILEQVAWRIFKAQGIDRKEKTVHARVPPWNRLAGVK
jgi:uncharacterized protein with GYD domain